MLEGDVEIRQHAAIGHQRQHTIDMRIGIDIVETHPDAERAERLGQTQEPRLVLLAAPRTHGIAEIEAVGAGVLRDDEKLLDAGGDQPLGLAHHVAQGTALEPPAQCWDDAEAATIVAAFGDLHIGVMAA
jgi:hypothetical protein